MTDEELKAAGLMKIHEEAMEAAHQADLAERGAKALREQAADLEAKAASMVADRLDLDQTRAILHRSAAWLAVKAGRREQAIELAQTGLAGCSRFADLVDELWEVLAAAEALLLPESHERVRRKR